MYVGHILTTCLTCEGKGSVHKERTGTYCNARFSHTVDNIFTCRACNSNKTTSYYTMDAKCEDHGYISNKTFTVYLCENCAEMETIWVGNYTEIECPLYCSRSQECTGQYNACSVCDDNFIETYNKGCLHSQFGEHYVNS